MPRLPPLRPALLVILLLAGCGSAAVPPERLFCAVGGYAGPSDTPSGILESEDGGRTWSNQIVLRDEGPGRVGNPCVIVERGTYNVIKLVAYEFHERQLRELWRWSNDDRGVPRSYWGQGAHRMHAVDVDGDGRDEVIIGSAAIDDDGTELWSTGLGHPVI